jgi:hypothetical protein
MRISPNNAKSLKTPFHVAASFASEIFPSSISYTHFPTSFLTSTSPLYHSHPLQPPYLLTEQMDNITELHNLKPDNANHLKPNFYRRGINGMNWHEFGIGDDDGKVQI